MMRKMGCDYRAIAAISYSLAFLSASVDAQNVIYVKRNTAAGDDGLSWTTAFDHLTDALTHAQSNPQVNQIWVAAGTYRPDESAASPGGTDNRDASFIVPLNVAVYGGFAGFESSLAQRNITANIAILSGDLAEDDVFVPGHAPTPPQFINYGENTHIVVDMTQTNDTARLDGFTIRSGNEDPKAAIDHGIAIDLEGSSPTVANCILERHAHFGNTGRTIRVQGPSASFIENCTFRQNGHINSLGGVESLGAQAINTTATFRNCHFEDNGIGLGLGGFNSSGVVEFCTFYRNRGRGASVGPNTLVRSCRFVANLDGGIDAGNAVIQNCLFVANRTTSNGGGFAGNAQSHRITQCTFFGNHADGVGGGIYTYCDEAVVVIEGCIIRENTHDSPPGGSPPVTSQVYFDKLPNGANGACANCTDFNINQATFLLHSNIQDYTQDCIASQFSSEDVDPLFVDPDGPDDILGTLDDNFRLAPGSPDQETGGCGGGFGGSPNLHCAEFDLDGNPRLWDGDDPDLVPEYDRGCYEYLQFCTQCPGPRVWVEAAHGDFTDHTNWTFSSPGPVHEAIFQQSGTPYTVTFPVNGAIDNQRLSIFRGDVTFDLNGSMYTLTNPEAPGTVILADANLDVANLSLVGGGTLRAPTVRIAKAAGSTSALSVGGPGTTLFVEDDLCIGCFGQGALTISDGAETISFIASVGEQVGAHGEVSIIGGESVWFVPFFLLVERGTVTIDDGLLVLGFGGAIVLQEGAIEGNGGDLGLGGLEGNVLSIGTVDPGQQEGSGVGTLIINGDYQQVGFIPGFGDRSGKLVIDLVQVGEVVESDRLDVLGEASLGGGLIVRKPEGVPMPDTFDATIFTAASFAATNETFDVAFLPSLGPGSPKFLRVNYPQVGVLAGSSDVTLSVADLSSILEFGPPGGANVNGQPTAAVLADFDGDGLDDLAVTVTNGPSSAGQVYVLINDGRGGFESATGYSVGIEPSDLVFAQLNADTGFDLAIANQGDGNVSILLNLNDGSGTFVPAITVSLPPGAGEPSAIAAGNFDGPSQTAGEIDLAITSAASGAVVVLQNDGTAKAFFPILVPHQPLGTDPLDIDPADVDNDRGAGALDLVVAYAGSNIVAVYRNTSQGGSLAFAPPAGFDVGDSPTAVAVADLNNDSLPEIITANAAASSTNYSISVLVNHSAGGISFAPAVNLPMNGPPRSVVAVNLDAVGQSDNDLDLAVLIDGSPDGFVQVLRNDSDPAPGAPVALSALDDPPTVTGGAIAIVAGTLDTNGISDDLVVVNGLPPQPLDRGGLQQNINLLFSTSKAVCPTTCQGDIGAPCETDGVVNVSDLLAVINLWGVCVGCPADVTGDNVVDVNDLLVVINAWGDCP